MLRGTLTLDITNATKEAPAKSELLDLGGYKWQIIYPDEHSSAEHFLLICNQNCTDNLWLCSAKYSVETKEGTSYWKELTEDQHQHVHAEHPHQHQHVHTEHQHQQQHIHQCSSSSSNTYWFNSYDNVRSKLKGSGQRTPSSVKVYIEIEWFAPKSSLHPLDATLNMIFGGQSDLVPINKFVLATHSNYFRNLFFGALAAVSSGTDANGNPIYDIHEDPDFNHSQFRFMIHAFLCMGSMLDQLGDSKCANDKEQKIALLKLAVKYQMQMFVDFAEKQLIRLGTDTMELLALADQFTLPGLKDHCLQTITPNNFCKQLGKNIGILAGLGKETRSQLDAKLEECANKNWRIA